MFVGAVFQFQDIPCPIDLSEIRVCCREIGLDALALLISWDRDAPWPSPRGPTPGYVIPMPGLLPRWITRQ